MSSSWLKTAVQRSKAAWQVLTQKSSTSSVGTSCQSDLSNVSQACSSESASSFTSVSCVEQTCTSSSCAEVAESAVNNNEQPVNDQLQQNLATDNETDTERIKQVLRFMLSSEIMHLSTDGTYVYPVKTPEQLIQENIGKIALLQRSTDASELEFKYLVQPMIYACARMCLMLPGSNHHHDSFTGGLFAHNLNLALTALDKLHQFDTGTGSKSEYGLGSRCSIREELMYKFKLNSIASQDDARCFAEVWSTY